MTWVGTFCHCEAVIRAVYYKQFEASTSSATSCITKVLAFLLSTTLAFSHLSMSFTQLFLSRASAISLDLQLSFPSSANSMFTLLKKTKNISIITFILMLINIKAFSRNQTLIRLCEREKKVKVMSQIFSDKESIFWTLIFIFQ